MGSLEEAMMKAGLVLLLALTIGVVVGQSGECEQDTDCTDDHICQDTNCIKRGVFCNEEKHCNKSLVGTACLDSGLCGCLNTGNCVEGRCGCGNANADCPA